VPRISVGFLLGLVLFPTASVSVNADPQPAIGDDGLDLTAQDPAVKPGDDFYRYAEGHWLQTQQIPADRTRWGSFDQLAVLAEEQVRQLIQALPANAPSGSLEQKVGDYYRAYLDTKAIDAAGLRPARPALEAIAKAHSHQDIARLMGRPDLGLESPIGAGIGTDDKNPDRYLVGIGQAGLGLPDRDYYLKPDPQFAALRDAYRRHLENVFKLADQPDSVAKSQAVFDLETRIAQLHWPRAKRRDRDLTYNIRTLAQLQELAPTFPWTDFFQPQGLAQRTEYDVAELDAVGQLGKLFTQIPVTTWQAYLTVHYLDGNASVLPKPFDEEHFDFYGRQLSGQLQQKERWKRAVAAASGALGEAVGQLYVRRYFPPEQKAQVQQLVENLRSAYRERFQSVPWMTPGTRKIAAQKLTTFRPKIAYPDKWRDYSPLVVRAGDAFGNGVRASVFEWQRELKRIDLPTDRDEWMMTPQTINAYYNPTFNEIVFPAGILQPPFFGPHADAAVNYGAIGAVIGHEMGHGFDDQGAKSDAQGVLRSWWSPQDTVAFKQLGDKLASQYDAYEPLPGFHVNGRLTLGENIGDLSGLTVAHEAYRLSLKGKPAPVIDHLTGDQRFFLAYAQVWRELQRDEALRNQVTTNAHSPAQYRVNGVVRNVDAWYDAFNVKPGDKLYLPPNQRVHIW
jgi:putative endopeptidase